MAMMIFSINIKLLIDHNNTSKMKNYLCPVLIKPVLKARNIINVGEANGNHAIIQS